jgi:ATP-dependent helicase/nuclease subunit B
MLPSSRQALMGRPAKAAADALLGFAAANGVPVVQRCTPGKDWRHSPGSGLSYLARHLSSSEPCACEEVPDDIRMAAHPDPAAEIHACARRILSLCRDGGCRFRELAVLVPDTAEYAADVRKIFRLHGIPFFMDRKESLAGNPIVVALLAAFDILRGGWRHDDVFRLLKTGLLPVSQPVIDRLENHALAKGLRGGRLWCEHRLEDTDMEEVRVMLTAPLQAFRTRVRGRVPVREALGAYLEMLLAWRLPQTAALRAKTLEASGNLAPAGHLRQIWQSACTLMDQIVELAGEGTLTLTELHGMMQTGLESGTTGIIPPSLDEVFVGTPSRSQVSQCRHLFVLGVAEGWIPAVSGGQGLLTDADRRMMALHGLELAPDSRAASRERKDELDAVIAMPTEGLWFSRPVSDAEGKAIQPSPVWREVRGMFPMLREGWASGPDGEMEPWCPEILLTTTPRALLEVLAPRLRDAEAGNAFRYSGKVAASGSEGTSSFLVKLFDLCGRQPGMSENCRRVAEGLDWRNSAALSPQWFRERYGTIVTGSVSSMEMYRRCPFSWFASHAAMLRERETCGLRDVGFGLLMHGAMDAVVTSIERDGGWDAFDGTSLPAYAEEAARQGIARGVGISPLHPGLASWFSDRLAKAVLTAAKRVARQIQAGAFRPYGQELGFGDREIFPPFVVALPNGGSMRLQGRLDRLDMCDMPDGRYLRVVDYKSGDRSLALPDIVNGLSMQLPAYLAVALASLGETSRRTGGLPVLPAGIFHMRLEPPDIRTGGGSASGAETERNRRMRLSGYVLEEPAVLAAMDYRISDVGTSEVIKASVNRDGNIAGRTKTLSRQGFERMGSLLGTILGNMGERLVSGDISISPIRIGSEKACDRCPYGWVCRFEPGVGNAGWNRLPEVSEADVRRMLEDPGNGVRHDLDG